MNDEEMNPPEEEYAPPEDEGAAPGEPTAQRPASSPLPWFVAGVSVLLLALFGLYSMKTVSDAKSRAASATRKADDLSARFDKMDEERKAAASRSADLSAHNDELTAKVSALQDQLKDKDAANARLQQAQDAMATKLKAAKSGPAKGLARQLLAMMPKNDAGAASAKGKSVKASKKARGRSF